MQKHSFPFLSMLLERKNVCIQLAALVQKGVGGMTFLFMQLNFYCSNALIQVPHAFSFTLLSLQSTKWPRFWAAPCWKEAQLRAKPIYPYRKINSSYNEATTSTITASIWQVAAKRSHCECSCAMTKRRRRMRPILTHGRQFISSLNIEQSKAQWWPCVYCIVHKVSTKCHAVFPWCTIQLLTDYIEVNCI